MCSDQNGPISFLVDAKQYNLRKSFSILVKLVKHRISISTNIILHTLILIMVIKLAMLLSPYPPAPSPYYCILVSLQIEAFSLGPAMSMLYFFACEL